MAERALQFSPRSILKFLGNRSAILGQEQSSDFVWDTLLFPQGQQRSCFVSLVLPPLWDGGDITLRMRLTTSSAGANARFEIKHAVIENGDDRTAASSSVFVAASDLTLTGADAEEDFELSAVPVAVPEDVILFEITRLGTHPNDTAGDVKLLGLSLLYEDGSSGTGEENTLSSVGSGTSLVKGKVGVDLRIKSLTAGANITITGNADDVQIAASGGSGEVNTASNVGGGSGIFRQKTGVDLELKSLVAGANITITPSTDTITIAASASSGESNTASNVGGGSGVFKQKTGVDLEMKSLVAGANVTVTPGTDTITIGSSAPGEVNTMSNVGTGANVYKSKTGVNFNLRTLAAGSQIEITEGTNEITIAVKDVGFSSWEETFFVDFTAETPVDLKAGGDGTVVIGGKNFEVLNSGVASVMEIGSSGLDIQSVTNGQSTIGYRTAPTLYAFLEDLVPGIGHYDEFRMTIDFDFVGTPTAFYEYLVAGFHVDNPSNYFYNQGIFFAGAPGMYGVASQHVGGVSFNPPTGSQTFAALGYTPGGARVTWGQQFFTEISTQTFAAEDDIDAMEWRTVALASPHTPFSQWDFSTTGFKPIIMLAFDFVSGSGLLLGFRVRKLRVERRVSPYPVTIFV